MMMGDFQGYASKIPHYHPPRQTTSLNRPHSPLPFPASALIGVWSVLRTHQDYLSATAYRSPMTDRYSAKQQCRCVLTRSVVCCGVGRGLMPPPYDDGGFSRLRFENPPLSSPTADHLPQSPPLAIAVSRFRFNRCLVGASHPPRLFIGYRLPMPNDGIRALFGGSPYSKGLTGGLCPHPLWGLSQIRPSP